MIRWFEDTGIAEDEKKHSVKSAQPVKKNLHHARLVALFEWHPSPPILKMPSVTTKHRASQIGTTTTCTFSSSDCTL